MNTIELPKKLCKLEDCEELTCIYDDYCEKEHDFDCNKFCSPLHEAFHEMDDSIMLPLNEIAFRGLLQAIEHFIHSEQCFENECNQYKSFMMRTMFQDLYQRIIKQEHKSKGSNMVTSTGSFGFVPKEER